MTDLLVLTAVRDPVGVADAEDAPLLSALAARGLDVRRLPWSDLDPAEPGLRVLRTTWDYSERIDSFRDWLGRQPPDRLVNPPELVTWNLDKRYLVALAERGLPVVPTRVLTPGVGEALVRQFGRHGTSQVVVKPAVSASGRDTRRMSSTPSPEDRQWLERQVARQALVVQPFDRRVLERGELSLVWIDGRITHAVRKRPARGEFRVQQEHGGRWEPHRPTAAEREIVERFIDACPVRPVFARIDGFEDHQHGLMLMELELIEPELFLPDHPQAAQALADALLRRC